MDILKEMPGWIATIIAAISAGVAYISSRNAYSSQQEAAKKNEQFLEKEHHLRLKEWTEQYFIAVRLWAEKVTYAISEGVYVIDKGDANIEEVKNILINLRTLIDTGRWYFPNQWAEDYGVEKPPAYRGIRQPILDCVCDAYMLIENSTVACASKEELINIQRNFVSYVQEVLDPRQRERN